MVGVTKEGFGTRFRPCMALLALLFTTGLRVYRLVSSLLFSGCSRTLPLYASALPDVRRDKNVTLTRIHALNIHAKVSLHVVIAVRGTRVVT